MWRGVQQFKLILTNIATFEYKLLHSFTDTKMLNDHILSRSSFFSKKKKRENEK